jgi:hypothetical protein
MELTDIQYVQFADTTDKILSNKLLVSDYLILARTRPDPRTEEIDRIYSDIQNGDLSKVLDLLHYAILDEIENEESSSVLATNRTTEKKEEKKRPESLYDLSTYKPNEHTASEKAILHSSISLSVLDIIKYARTKAISTKTKEDIRGEEQEENLGNIAGNEGNEAIREPNPSYSMLKSDRKKLINYFENLFDKYQERLYGNKQVKASKLTLSDITKYLVALELIMEYGGKTEKYDEKDHQYFFGYLPFYGKYKNDNVKGCCLNLFGNFLMLTRTGFREYEFEYTKKKIAELKDEALINTIVCLINNRWDENELHYFYSMSLNTLHYLGWKDISEFDENLDRMTKQVNKRVSELKHRASGVEENLKLFFDKICPAFNNVLSKIADKYIDVSASQGQIIYKVYLGYCYIHSVNNSNDFTLIRPGFRWDKEKEDFLRHTPDEIYTPVRLNSFICTDL